MALLTREQILAADDTQKELVPVPEWGGDVWVYGLSGTLRDRFEEGTMDLSGKRPKVDLDNLRARLCALAMRDEKGSRLFDDSHVRELGMKSSAALNRVYEVAQRLSGMGPQDVQEMAKNFEPARGSGSGSS